MLFFMARSAGGAHGAKDGRLCPHFLIFCGRYLTSIHPLLQFRLSMNRAFVLARHFCQIHFNLPVSVTVTSDSCFSSYESLLSITFKALRDSPGRDYRCSLGSPRNREIEGKLTGNEISVSFSPSSEPSEERLSTAPLHHAEIRSAMDYLRFYILCSRGKTLILVRRYRDLGRSAQSLRFARNGLQAYHSRDVNVLQELRCS
jgi:hypothetical protein